MQSFTYHRAIGTTSPATLTCLPWRTLRTSGRPRTLVLARSGVRARWLIDVRCEARAAVCACCCACGASVAARSRSRSRDRPVHPHDFSPPHAQIRLQDRGDPPAPGMVRHTRGPSTAQAHCDALSDSSRHRVGPNHTRVAHIGSQAGLNATNTRLASGAVGVPESRLEVRRRLGLGRGLPAMAFAGAAQITDQKGNLCCPRPDD